MTRRYLAKIPILTNPLTMAPFPSSLLVPASPAFHRQYGCSRCIREKRNGSKGKEELGFLGSGLKIHLLLARLSPRILTLFTMLFLSFSFIVTSFSLFLDLYTARYFACSPVDSLYPSLVPRAVALTINK